MAKKKKNKTNAAPAAPAMTYEQKQVAEAAKKKKKRNILIAVAVAAVAAIIAFVLLGSANTGIFAAHTNAATVGGVRVSTPLYDYYYENTYYALVNGYGSEDLESALGEDWKDLVISYADYNLQQDIAMYTEAVNEGMTLSEEGQATVDAAVSEMELKAEQYGYESVDRYLGATVGAGCTIENYRQYMEIQTLASEYSAAYRASLSFTQEDIDARYNEDPSRYDMYSFYSCYLKGISEADARAVAAQITDLDSYDSAIVAYRTEHPESLEDGADAEAVPSETSFRNNLRADYVNSDILAWIQAAPRSEGDVTYVNYNDRGYFIVYFVAQNEDRAVVDDAITEDLTNNAVTAWTTDLLERYPVEHSWLGMQGVGAYDR